jgi:glycosyl transferase family 4
MTVRKRILCVSFSDIGADSRVLRQLDVLAELGEVTTLGYGHRPAAATEHLEVGAGLGSLPQTPLGVALLALRRHQAVELRAPAVREALRLVGERTFDLVVANEARAMAFALRVARGAPVVADLHEWAPEERTHVRSWRWLVKPFMEHQCAKYLPKMSAVTVVNDAIGAMYETHFGACTRTVRNASAFRDLAPSAVVDGRIRLVHSGGAVRGRNIETLIDTVRLLDERFTLDLYLVPARDGGRYLDALRARIAGEPRVRLYPPVPTSELVDTLNAYDLGVYSLPPLTPNHWLMLPNKIFDFVQARLGVVFNSAAETDRLIREHELGAIAADASAEALRDVLAPLTAERVRELKRNADQAAKALSSLQDAAVTSEVVARLLDRPA